jgi:hypothetical protein
MSSQQNFRNPTHGSEVVNVTRCAPWPTWPGQAGPSVPKIPQKFHQIAQNKREKFVKKNIFGKIWSNILKISALLEHVTIFLVVKFYLVNYEYWFYEDNYEY